MILLQAIIANGGISADWVLVILSGILGTVFTWLLIDMRATVKEVLRSIQRHDVEIQLLKKDHENIEKLVSKLNPVNS